MGTKAPPPPPTPPPPPPTLCPTLIGRLDVLVRNEFPHRKGIMKIISKKHIYHNRDNGTPLSEQYDVVIVVPSLHAVFSLGR
jgi:hypothetical protein